MLNEAIAAPAPVIPDNASTDNAVKKGAAVVADPKPATDSKTVVDADKKVEAAPGAEVKDSTGKHKLVIDGQEVEMNIDEIVKKAQKAAGADKRFNDAFKMKQQAEQFMNLLKTDPMKIFTNPKLGIDIKKFAQDILAKEIEMEMMTPEQRELHETKEKLRLVEEEKKKTEEEAHRKTTENLVKHYSIECQKDIEGALQTSGLPKTRTTVRRLAYYMEKGLQRGVELKAADVVDLVRSDFIAEHNELYGATDGDTLLKLLGDATTKKILEANLKKVRGAGSDNGKPGPLAKPGNAGINDTPSNKMTKDEWRKMLDEHVNSIK